MNELEKMEKELLEKENYKKQIEVEFYKVTGIIQYLTEKIKEIKENIKTKE